MKWRNKGYTLKTQLTLTFMVMSVFALAVSSVFVYRNVIGMLQRNSEKSTIQLFRQAEYSIKLIRDEVDRVSKSIILDARIQRLLDVGAYADYEKVSSARDVIDYFDQIINNNQDIDSIYLFNEHDQMIEDSRTRGNFTTTSLFYHTDTYLRSKNNFPKLTWVGANKPYYQLVAGKTDSSPNIISAARGVKSLTQQTQSGTIVVNINQATLSAIYGNLSSSTRNRLLLLDEYGTVISSTEPQELGTKKANFMNLIDGDLFGSKIVEENGSKWQLVYYRISDSDWTLARLIPTKEFYQNASTLQKIMLAIFSISLAVSLLISYYWIRKITTPLRLLSNSMKEIEKGQLEQTVASSSHNELGMLIRRFNQMSRSIVELVKENKRIEQEARNLEIQSLQSQINPHFLYNTLNTIKSMAIVAKATNVAESITALGNILRPIFKNPSLFTVVQEELQFAVYYAQIMNVRYGTMINVTTDVDQELLDDPIPRFLFQPLLENSFLHGFARRPIGSIRIEGKEENDLLVFTVTDTGEGMSGEKVEQLMRRLAQSDPRQEVESEEGIGLTNVNRRIKLHYGSISYGLEIASTVNEGTTVVIRLRANQKS